MSYSPDFAKFSGKAPVNSSFAQTCNRLSQYMKGRCNLLGDIRLGIDGKSETKGSSSNARSTCLSPPIVDLDPSGPISAINQADFVSSQSRSSQMIIFYAGRVMVFDEVPANKAMEIMALAGNGSFAAIGGFDSSSGADRIGSCSSSPAVDPTVLTILGSGTNSAPRLPGAVLDLPIARRASLHQFLAKRKDRVAARTPYHQVNKPTTSYPTNNYSNVNIKSQSSEDLELKL